MSGLCTLSSSWPFFTLSSRRALMSTTRPLASEMTGTSREMSGRTEPVAFSSAADSTPSAVASGNLADVLAVDGDQVHVGHLDDLGRRWRAVALLLVFASCKCEGHACRGACEHQIAKLLRMVTLTSLDYLASDGKIQLAGGGQIGPDQLQVGQVARCGSRFARSGNPSAKRLHVRRNRSRCRARAVA